MKLALDTNAYVALARGEAATVQWAEQASQLLLPLPVLGELRVGFELGKKAKENERTLARFLQQEQVEVIAPDLETTFHYARIFGNLKRAGTPIPINDVWIAALVVQHGATLHTYDRHFEQVAEVGMV